MTRDRDVFKILIFWVLTLADSDKCPKIAGAKALIEPLIIDTPLRESFAYL